MFHAALFRVAPETDPVHVSAQAVESTRRPPPLLLHATLLGVVVAPALVVAIPLAVPVRTPVPSAPRRARAAVGVFAQGDVIPRVPATAPSPHAGVLSPVPASRRRESAPTLRAGADLRVAPP